MWKVKAKSHIDTELRILCFANRFKYSLFESSSLENNIGFYFLIGHEFCFHYNALYIACYSSLDFHILVKGQKNHIWLFYIFNIYINTETQHFKKILNHDHVTVNVNLLIKANYFSQKLIHLTCRWTDSVPIYWLPPRQWTLRSSLPHLLAASLGRSRPFKVKVRVLGK